MTDTKIKDCDVIIIGAGMAGLTAGAILGKAGLKVRILEAETQIGGYAAGFNRNGFSFDTSIHWLNQLKSGSLSFEILDYLGADFPKCKPLTRIRRYKGDTFDYLLTSNPLELRETLLQDFPDEKEGIQRFFRDTLALSGCMDKTQFLMRTHKSMSIWESMGWGWKALRWFFPMFKFIRASAEEGVKKYFSNPQLQSIFCSEMEMMSVVVPFAWAFSGDYQAPPEGGSEAIPRWLKNRIDESGSDVRVNQRVKRILTEENRAAGVELEDGARLLSDYVIAACDIQTVYEKMIPKGMISEEVLTNIRGAELYDSAVSVFIGLDCEPGSLGFNEELVFITRDNNSREDHSSGDPNKAGLTVFSPSFRDPSLAPVGKGTLIIYCSARIEFADYWKTGDGKSRGERYKAFKKEYADIVIKRTAEAVSPDLPNHIEFVDMATPLTYQRYTGNRLGSIMGPRPSRRNIRNKIAHYITPVDHLFLTGHWSEYGGGIPIAIKSAANTSLLLLKKMRHPAFAELRDVMDGKTLKTIR